MSDFKDDKIENEQSEPKEGSDLKFINVPFGLLMLFLGFGITYLTLQTDNVKWDEGNSRTKVTATDQKMVKAGNDLSESTIDLALGKKTYTAVCQACHQATGAGIPGAFPSLGDTIWVKGSAERMASMVLLGIQGKLTVKGAVYQGVMPPFKGQLSDKEISAVLSYVRSSFGNKAGNVPADIAKAARERWKDKTTSWNGEEELNKQVWKD